MAAVADVSEEGGGAHKLAENDDRASKYSDLSDARDMVGARVGGREVGGGRKQTRRQEIKKDQEESGGERVDWIQAWCVLMSCGGEEGAASCETWSILTRPRTAQ
jgi:hypothetical protein